MRESIRLIMAAVLAAMLAKPAIAADPNPGAELTAAQIIEKNVAARGGLEAWRRIQTMVWVGHMETAETQGPSMAFSLQQKRPNKTRFEVLAMNQKSTRIFDGAHGWKVHPAADGRPQMQSYTPQELKFARQAQGIDGPLIDYAAKGNTVTLQGTEEIEGRKAYRLSVRLASGERNDVWVDARTFLDIRLDRTSFNPAGAPGTVTVFYRDYRDIEGLQFPSRIEVGAGSARVPDKMVIEKIALNPPLQDGAFAKPQVPGRRNLVTIDAEPMSAADRMRHPAPVKASPGQDPGSAPQ